jgi:ketosteroid isomerase-like protein
MSEENVEIAHGVRFPVAVSGGTKRRTLEERIAVRFPRPAVMLASAVTRLPPRSRLRRVLLARAVRRAYEAANRRDFEVTFLLLDPDVEFRFSGAFAPPGLAGWHRGHEGYRRVWEAGIEAWDDLRVEPDEIFDYGDQIVICGRQVGHGTGSGVLVSQPVFQVITLRRGLILRQEDFADRDAALEAAGLSE